MHAIITGTEGRHHRGRRTQTHQDSKSCMTTSSNGNIFCVTGNLCGEFTGPRWIPRTKASDVTRCFGVFLDLHPNKRLSKQWWGWWFETPSRPLWCDCNWLDTKRLQFLAATKQLYEWFSPSVRPSVCLSVRPSVCPSHLFDYVPIIVSSRNFQELLPMTEEMSMQKVKVIGQRSRSQRSWPNLWAPVRVHIWWWNDG